jgi:hypothetical protein
MGRMNWKLILLLSMFGLVMAFATVFVISSTVEPFCWLAIFVVCAYLIARRAPASYFLHGLLVGILNGVWVTSAHVLLFDQYMVRHTREAEMMAGMPLAPKAMMLVTGPIVGVVSGIVLGILALIVHRLVSTRL